LYILDKKEVNMALLGTILWILGIVCAVWVIYDVFTNNRKLSTGLKVVWTIAALLFSIITAIIYYIVYKK
jgi:hypothetical protein